MKEQGKQNPPPTVQNGLSPHNNNNNNNNNCLFTNPNRKSEKEIKEVIPF